MVGWIWYWKLSFVKIVDNLFKVFDVSVVIEKGVILVVMVCSYVVN